MRNQDWYRGVKEVLILSGSLPTLGPPLGNKGKTRTFKARTGLKDCIHVYQRPLVRGRGSRADESEIPITRVTEYPL